MSRTVIEGDVYPVYRDSGRSSSPVYDTINPGQAISHQTSLDNMTIAAIHRNMLGFARRQ